MKILGLLTRADRNWLASFAVIFVGLALIPVLFGAYEMATFRDIMLFALFAVGLDLFWGRSGVLSFGHATFFGLGAYGMAIVTVTFGVPAGIGSWVGLATGLALAGCLAAAVAYFLFAGGVRGEYFTIITLTLSLIAQSIVLGWSSVTGSDSGLIGVPPLTIGDWSLSDETLQYYVAWGLLGIISLGLWLGLRGRLGRVLKAIEDNEIKTETLGYAAPIWLIVLFTVSATISALAGALFATMSGVVAPDLIGLSLSGEVIIWVALGGRGTILGPIIGTIIIWNLQQKISSIDELLWPLFMGLFFIVMVFALPDGLPSLGRRVRSLFERSRSAAGGQKQ